MNDLAGYEEIKRQHIRPNGHDASDALRLVRVADMRPRLSDGYLVKGLLGSTAMAVVFGESGSTKTMYMTHLAISISAGIEFFGRKVRQAGVVYIAAEAGRGIENRVIAAMRGLGVPDTIPFAAITVPIDLCTDDADVGRLIDAVRGADLDRPVELIVIDTLSRVMAGGNENQPDDMGALVRNIDRLRSETGAAVAVVHHSGKDASRGARGHSLLRAATDTEIEISKDVETKVATARVTKQREYPTDGTMTYSLRVVELGFDDDGDAITSCYIVEDTEPKTSVRKPTRLSPAQSRALHLLADAIDRDGEVPPASNHIPAGVRCVSETLWREYCYRGAISGGDGESAKRMAFNRASEKLIADGHVGKWEPFVWLV